MASKIIPAFIGPLTPTALDAWLGQCEDGFAIYASTKAEKSPTLDIITMIRLTGTQLQEPTMAAWWNSGRKEYLLLTSWEAFEKKIRERFLPKGYKLLALRVFFLCEQGKLPFADYAAALADARNAAGEKIIGTHIFKCQLLFHSHPFLLLRIMAIPDFTIDGILQDDLVALMSMQWESLIAEGITVKSSTRSALNHTPVVSSTPSTLSTTKLTLPPLTEPERSRITELGGCWKCRKVPTDAGWTNHIGRTCPGDVTRGILPGRDFVAVKKEVTAVALLNDDEDQPDHRHYASFVFGGRDSDGEDQPEAEIPIFYRDEDTDDESI